MSPCRNCQSDQARPTKTLCWACYHAQRRTGRPRPEHNIIRHNVRRYERDTQR